MFVFFLSAGTYSVNFCSDMSQKNLNADMTNPNFYQTIDGAPNDHVYDEIKQKEGYKEPGKFFFFLLFFVEEIEI